MEQARIVEESIPEDKEYAQDIVNQIKEVIVMKETEKILIYNYILKNRQQLEYNVRQLQANIRFRDIGVADCVELIVALQRLETFKEVTRHILILMKMHPFQPYNKESE